MKVASRRRGDLGWPTMGSSARGRAGDRPSSRSRRRPTHGETSTRARRDAGPGRGTGRRPGRPSLAEATRTLILRLARENCGGDTSGFTGNGRSSAFDGFRAHLPTSRRGCRAAPRALHSGHGDDSATRPTSGGPGQREEDKKHA
jgi:hypothetical protein